ncbi:MAG TPA: hypothetical protein PK340_03520 [Bacilli bacterium]|nr:hypothetical protein [Bacilli bacterium]
MKLSKYIFVSSALLIGIGLSINPSTVETNAVITSSDIRISVVRPSWWENDGAHQVLRIAATSDDLTNDVGANITYVGIESYTADTYYASGGGFTEYTTAGVIFYDVPLATISGKYVDLARSSTNDPLTASVWNNTAPEAFNTNLLHKIWRIWNDGNGIYRPEGESAESRNVSNAVINSLLYGYLSCSDSTTHGYGAFNALDTNFNLSGRTYGETDTVLDFVDEDDYATGRGDGVTVLTSAKVAMMEALYDAAYPGSGLPPMPSENNDAGANVGAVISLLSLASLLSLGYLILVKKMKRS